MRCWRGIADGAAPAFWGRLFILAIVGLLGGAGGCLRPAPPKLDLAKPSPPPAKLNLEAYLQAARTGEWVYERTELRSDGERLPTRYVRRLTGPRLSEGFLERRAMPPLERYLRVGRLHDTKAADDSQLPPLAAREAPQLFELDEPMPAIPPELTDGSPIETTTALRCYDRRGRLSADGTMMRRARLEGTETIDCPAGRFADCLRVRVELRIELSLGPAIDWNSYVWLSREAGEVRRIEEFSGAFWIFGFGSAHEYRLVSYSRGEQKAAEKPAPKWVRGLIIFDRPAPRPRVSGMMVDFAG